MSRILSLPGLIDIHVHLRDPGQTHKEDFFTGTCAALAGGVTTVFDMPNNVVPIFTKVALEEKMEIARQKAVCDWGLYFGTDGKNTHEFQYVANKVAGLKVYLTSTTGNYFVEDVHLLKNIFATWPKIKPIVVHAEGEKINLACKLALRFKKKIHVTHIATREALENVLLGRKKGLDVTCDVTPHHLFLTDAYAKKYQNLATVKPPLGSQKDVDYLWDHLSDIDCIATDHAPHTQEEKKSKNSPFGMPGLEIMLPLLMTAVYEKRLYIEDIIRMTNTNPRRIFGIGQDPNTYTEIDSEEDYTIGESSYFTKCGWSPFEGKRVFGKVKNVFIAGRKVYSEGTVLVSAGFGKNHFFG
ncbi:amidohydrolase family protein [Candidatus Gottesmanbacteria bacterium]|nr:amidohydrolase family protein [Candidatus Gottesmanbacteria bacterium]